jgi:5'-nucleotidase
MEGAMLGIPAVALSQVLAYQKPIHWETSERFLPAVIERLLTASWRGGGFFNVNVPDLPPDAVTGVRLTRQGRRPPGSFRPVRRVDERHVPYYWVKISHNAGGDEDGTDLQAIKDGAISVTPLQLDLTDTTMKLDLTGVLQASQPRVG